MDNDQLETSGSEKRKKCPSPAVIARLPRYYRCLKELLSCDILRVSSSELAREMNCTASQIRQDLSYFGAFGQQGYGYNVKYLYTGISSVLGVTDEFGAVIFGAGAMGQALAQDPVFAKRGVILRGIYDSCAENIGKELAGHEIRGVDDMIAFIYGGGAEILVLTCPLPEKYDISKLIADQKLRGIWNFTSEELKSNSKTLVRNVFLGDSLMTLCYDIKQTEK